MIFFRKPAPTFRDHALAADCRMAARARLDQDQNAEEADWVAHPQDRSRTDVPKCSSADELDLVACNALPDNRALCSGSLMVRRTCLASVLATAVALATSPAGAQSDFPSRRIHVIVPYPAGGIVDIATRVVTDKLTEIWRQPFVVETKPGANGSLAWDQVARAEPDGYTWTFLG